VIVRVANADGADRTNAVLDALHSLALPCSDYARVAIDALEVLGGPMDRAIVARCLT
jgi:hypothetical protein